MTGEPAAGTSLPATPAGVLTREARHLVKNTLQTVVDLAEMEADLCADAAARHGFSRLRQRALALSCALDAIPGSGEIARTDLGHCLERLIGLLREDAERAGIALSLETTPVQLRLEQAFPCALLVTELVTNALRHAFPADRRAAAPLVQICLSREAGRGACVLEVRDNGVGLPAPVEPGTTRSPGLRLAWLWATYQLRGSLEVTRGEGTAFRAAFAPREPGPNL